MCELLWSDPQPGEGRAPSKRGVGVAFGADVTRTFLKANNLDLLVRSHEVRLLKYQGNIDGTYPCGISTSGRVFGSGASFRNSQTCASCVAFCLPR